MTDVETNDFVVPDPHDRYFRHIMSNPVIAKQYFQHNLPSILADNINYSSLTMLESSFITPELDKYASDVVFECELLNLNKQNKTEESSEEAKSESSKLKLVLLIEHQSSADRFMAYRVFQYMFNLFERQFKQRESKSELLTPIYPMVFYNGKQRDYRYSLDFADGFDDPLSIMRKVLTSPIHLINVNYYDDDDLKQQKLLGLVTRVMKFRNITDQTINYLIEIFKDLDLLVVNKHELEQYLRPTMAYLWTIGEAEDLQSAIVHNKTVPEAIRGEFMTAAELYTQKGEKLGFEKGQRDIAINALQQGFEVEMVVNLTKLDIVVVNELKAQLDL